jgi:hypothetical protein
MNDAEWKDLTDAFPRLLQSARVEKSLRALKEREHQPPLLCGAFSPDGTMIALSGGGRIPSNPAIWIARVPSFETVAALRGHQGVHALAWDPKTGLLASASSDYCAALWDVERGDHVFVCGGNEEPIVKGAVAFGDGVLYSGESESFQGWARACSAPTWQPEMSFRVRAMPKTHGPHTRSPRRRHPPGKAGRVCRAERAPRRALDEP